MASPTFIGELADTVVAVLQKPEVEALIAGMIGRGEVTIENAVASALNSMPRPGGVLSMFWPGLKSNINDEVKAIVAKYPPMQIVKQFIIPAAVREAKRLGG